MLESFKLNPYFKMLLLQNRTKPYKDLFRLASQK